MKDNEKLRTEIYSSYGKDFQDVSGSIDANAAVRWGKAYRWYLKGWMPRNKDAQIAELACGYGRLLQFFKQSGYTKVQGVDISPDQVNSARLVVPEVDQANVLDWLKYQIECFDLIVALDLIEHFTRDEALRFIELCFAALKPGGRLVLQTPNAESPFALQILYGDITHEWAYNVNQLSRLLKRARFQNVESREQGPVPWGYSPASTLRWIVWRVIRAGLQVWNISETGSLAKVLTRVFLISAKKPLQ